MNERKRFEMQFSLQFGHNFGETTANQEWPEPYWRLWQARAEIAEQDEKELIEALIEMLKATEKINNPDGSRDFLLMMEETKIETLIEKHKGKTWEEIQND